ncbi:inositol hexakisphosphate and diphosphoinositol-pentakisphosphate kinase VIP2-like protein isoform X2 [Tanacetum coccineum]
MADGLKPGVPWIMCKQEDAPQPMDVLLIVNMILSISAPLQDALLSRHWGFWAESAENVVVIEVDAFKKLITMTLYATGARALEGYIMVLSFLSLELLHRRFTEFGGVYHGGTNFGRTAGGPFIATSYDYDAPLDEFVVSAYGTTKLKVSLTKLSLLFGRVLVREWPGLAFDEGDEVGKCFQEDCSYGIGGGSVSRSKVMGRVYAANEAPPDLQDIPFHHDMTFFLSVLFVKSVLTWSLELLIRYGNQYGFNSRTKYWREEEDDEEKTLKPQIWESKMLIWRPGDAGIINVLEKSLCFDFGVFVTMVKIDYGLYPLDRDSWLTQRGKWGPGRAPRGSFSKVIVAAKNTGILARPSVGGRNKHCLLTPVSWRGSYTRIVAAAMARPKAISLVLGFGGNYIHHPAKKIQQSRDLGTFIADVISLASSKVVAAFAERREEKIYTTFRGFKQTLRQLFREISEMNGNTVNIAARKSVINISLLLHLIAKLNSFRSFCIGKRIQFPTTVSCLCPINKLAHLLFGTPKIPIHAHPRLCIGLSCTTLLKVVYRGGKTTPTTGGGSNEFRNDDEPNTTKRRCVPPQIIVFMMFSFICFVAITYERKAGILAGLPQLDCCCSQSNLASRVAVMVSGRSNVTRLWLNIECILLGCDDLSNMLCCRGHWKDGSVRIAKMQHQSSSESHGQSNSLLAKGKRKLDKYITIPVAKSSTTVIRSFHNH